MLRLFTFGSVNLEGAPTGDAGAVLAQPKRLALLVYLAAARPFRVHRRDDLLARFWPDLDDARARDALNQALRFLRQTLGPDAFVRRGGEDVGIDPGRLWCDAAAFQEALDAGRAADALELYRGDFLQGFFIEDGGGFEEWMERERSAHRESAARGARQLAETHASEGALTLAIDWGRRALEFAPDDERALRRLLRWHDRAGDRAGAFRAFEAFARRLEKEFGSEPSEQTRELIEKLKAGQPLTEERVAARPSAVSPRPFGKDPELELGDRYRIVRKLGAGGMATVYLAQDVKHDREVALKVLRPEISEGLARERFIREIRIAGRLQHPNIVPLFDSGEADGRLFYVMPHVPGETLRGRLARAGPLPFHEVIHILRELAVALAYAHGQGIIHRDIKPANILLSDRSVLLTDFGIARAAHAALTPAGSLDDALTQVGISLGTPAYMSPEQAAANPEIDQRADLYSLGVLGYEMLVGRPPFVRATPQEVLTAQLIEPPIPVGDLRADTPTGLAALVMRCLEKSPADRWQRAEEQLAALEAKAPAIEGIPAPKRRTRHAAYLAGAGVLTVLGLALALVIRQAGTPAVPAVTQHRQLTFDGTVQAAAISPDGSLLAYVAGGRAPDTAPTRLLVKDLRGGSTIMLARVSPVSNLALQWSPDGSSLFFWGSTDSTGRLGGLIYPSLGGTPRQSPCGARYAVPSPDGTRLACWLNPRNTRIGFVDLATQDTSSIPPPDPLSFLREGAWSPSGRILALRTNRMDGQFEIWSVRPHMSEWHRLVTDSVVLFGLAWSPAGDAVYYRRGDELWRIGVRSNGMPRGAPEVLQTGLPGAFLSITADGKALIYTKDRDRSNIWSATVRGRAGSGRFTWTPLTQGTGSRSAPAISPDGASVAYHDKETGDLVVTPFGGGAASRVIASGEAVSGPAWSPDGNQLAFWTSVQGTRRLRIVEGEGGSGRTYEHPAGTPEPPRWAPGTRILYQLPSRQNYHFLDPGTGAEEALVANDSVGWMFRALVSPGERFAAAFWNRKGDKAKNGLWLISRHDSSQRQLLRAVFQSRAYPIGWSADGRSVYVGTGEQIRVVFLPTGATTRVIPIPFHAQNCSALEHPAGLKLACVAVETESDVWMMQNFDPKAPANAR